MDGMERAAHFDLTVPATWGPARTAATAAARAARAARARAAEGNKLGVVGVVGEQESRRADASSAGREKEV